MTWALQFNGSSTFMSFTKISTFGTFTVSGEFVTGLLSDHGLVMGQAASNANFVGDVQGAGFYARIANVDSSDQAMVIADSTRYTWSVSRDANDLVTVILGGVGSYTFTAAGLVELDRFGRNNFGFYFDGQLINATAVSEDDPQYSWSADASDRTNTGLQPVFTDTLQSNDATGSNFATDGTDWVDLGGVSDSVVLTEFSTTGRYIFNRELNDSDRSIDVNITLTGDPSGGIQWRLVNKATSLPIAGFDWATFLASPTDGSHEVAVSVPTSTGLIYYKLQLRFTANIGINTESVNEFAVGVNVVDNGQSNCLRRDVVTDTPPTVNAAASYCTTAGWQPTFSTGNGAIAKVNALITLLNVPVGYYNNGENSAPLDYFVTGTGWTRLSTLLTNHMDNFFELMNFDQGERDAVLGTSEAVYQAGQQTLYDNLLSQMSRTQSDLTFCVNYGGNSSNYNAGSYTNATLETIRDAKRLFVAANSGAIFGGHRIDLPLADDIHNLAAGYEVAAAREIQSYAVKLGLDTITGDGRSITTATVNGSDLTVNYSAGDNLSKVGTSGVTITQITEDGFSSLITINDTVVNNDNVVHTLASAPTGQVQVRDYYGIDIDVSTRQNLVFPVAAVTSAPVVPVTINITAAGLPDDTYSVELWDDSTSPMTRIKVENITFTSGQGSSTLTGLVDVGTPIYTRCDTPTPFITGFTDFKDAE